MSTPSKQLAKIYIEEFKKEHVVDVKYLPVAITPESLKNVDLTKKKTAQIGLDPITLSVICGTVFGDSTLKVNKGNINAHLESRHSTRQTEWFLWKVLVIFSFCIDEETSLSFHLPDGKQKRQGLPGEIYGKWRVKTKVSTVLTELAKIIAPKNKKEFSRFWLNHMNNYFLMTLWLDDGSLLNSRQGVIACHNVPKEQVEILANYLKVVWNINCLVKLQLSRSTQTNPNVYEIYLGAEGLETLCRLIAPIIPVKSMLYKICFFPQDKSRLQRWTSELRELVRPEWRTTIDKYYYYRCFLREKDKHSEEDIVQGDIIEPLLHVYESDLHK